MSLTSIHDVGVALQAYLVEQGSPLAVVDGSVQPTTTWNANRVVIEHDIAGKGSFGPPRGLHTNAKHRYTATDPYKLTIYTRSAKAGASEFEHRSRAMLLRETVLAGLEYVARANKNRFVPTSGGFITPPDLAGTETPAGAVYELKFTYDLPIRTITFAQAARPEASLTGLASTTKVSRAGVPDDDNNPNTPSVSAETACGA